MLRSSCGASVWRLFRCSKSRRKPDTSAAYELAIEQLEVMYEGIASIPHAWGPDWLYHSPSNDQSIHRESLYIVSAVRAHIVRAGLYSPLALLDHHGPTALAFGADVLEPEDKGICEVMVVDH